MKIFLVICFSIILSCYCQKYTSRFDSLDIERVLSNDRILNNYIKCILDEGPCTSEGRELKTHIPEALKTSCQKCTDAQKRIVRRGSTFLMTKHPKQWERIARKYDPAGKHHDQFQQFLKS